MSLSYFSSGPVRNDPFYTHKPVIFTPTCATTFSVVLLKYLGVANTSNDPENSKNILPLVRTISRFIIAFFALKPLAFLSFIYNGVVGTGKLFIATLKPEQIKFLGSSEHLLAEAKAHLTYCALDALASFLTLPAAFLLALYPTQFSNIFGWFAKKTDEYILKKLIPG